MTDLTSYWTRVFSLLNSEKPQVYTFYARVILYGFFVWKLLSRDYRVFSLASDKVLNIYATETFAPHLGYTFTGEGWLVDLFTFHWIHWFAPLPNFGSMQLIYYSAVILCGLCIVLGSGPKNILPALVYALLSYLWGFNWRSGNDVDAIFIPLQAALVFAVYRGPNSAIWERSTFSVNRCSDAGFLYSMLLLVLIFYYQLSGLNKLIDIGFNDWFNYDLLTHLEDYFLYAEAGWHISINPIPFKIFSFFPEWLVSAAIPIVYCSHLVIFIIFFNRTLLPKFMYFYWAFHYVTTGLGIWFSGLLVYWLIFVPVYRVLMPLRIIYDPLAPHHFTTVRILKKANNLRLITFEINEGHRFAAVSPESPAAVHASRALTLAVWRCPLLLWLLPFLYFPILGGSLYQVVYFLLKHIRITLFKKSLPRD
ncbi:hypothetical protein N9V98_03205 [Luminiphilus sp.]|nr:hypothetical protein [Luminiphilus sp.]